MNDDIINSYNLVQSLYSKQIYTKFNIIGYNHYSTEDQIKIFSTRLSEKDVEN